MSRSIALLAALLLAPAFAQAGDTALSTAIPDVTELPAEKCTASQNKMLESIGLGETACALSKHLSVEGLANTIGVPIFQPHSRTNVLNASDNIEDFVRYNPAFFVKLDQDYTSDPDHLAYRLAYNNLLLHSARVFYLVGLDMQQKKKLSGLTMAQYKTYATHKKQTDQSWGKECRELVVNMQGISSTQTPFQDTFRDCNKSGNAALFWYRRQLDGSGHAILKLLDSVLKTQDPEFHAKAQQVLVKKS